MEIGVFEHILRVFFMLYFFEVILVGFILPTTVSGAKGLERTLFSLVGGAAENAAETKSDAERTLDIKAANLRDDPRATGALTRETDDQQAATVMVRVLESDKPVGDIIMLQADDHYVWIIGTQSKEHLRGTLAAATKHLDAHGMLISRSTWVAWSAIEHLDETAKGRVAVHLKSGDVVPVSRARTLDFMSRYARVKAV
jgi:DNA-binding LytR/AlgR family response regulator